MLIVLILAGGTFWYPVDSLEAQSTSTASTSPSTISTSTRNSSDSWRPNPNSNRNSDRGSSREADRDEDSNNDADTRNNQFANFWKGVQDFINNRQRGNDQKNNSTSTATTTKKNATSTNPGPRATSTTATTSTSSTPSIVRRPIVPTITGIGLRSARSAVGAIRDFFGGNSYSSEKLSIGETILLYGSGLIFLVVGGLLTAGKIEVVGWRLYYKKRATPKGPLRDAVSLNQ